MAVPRPGARRSIHEIDSAIGRRFQLFLSTPPLSDAFRPRAVARLERNMLSNQTEDLDKAILRLTESLLLPPRSWLERGSRILEALFFLAFALLERSKGSNQAEDATYAAKYFRHLRAQPHDALEYPHHEVTTILVDALAVQVELDAGNVEQTIGEMAALCHELLSSDPSEGDIARSVTIFSAAIRSKFSLQFPGQLHDQVIECLRVARRYEPDLREVGYVLAQSLGRRYQMNSVNDDYEEAVAIYDEIITSSPIEDEFVVSARTNVAMLAMIRAVVHETPKYPEETAYRARVLQEPFDSAAFDVEDQAEDTAELEQRFRYFVSTEGLEDSRLSQPLPVMSFDVPSPVTKEMELLEGLLSRIRSDDITEIDEAIQIGRTTLASASSDPRLSESFGEIVYEAFQRTNNIDYLNESISMCRQVLASPSPPSATLRQFSQSLLTRFASFPGHRLQDLDEALELLPQFLNDGHASSPERFRSGCMWAYVARGTRHPTVSTAYESAVSLMQDALLFSPTLQLQHARLAVTDVSHGVPLDYASYQIDLGQLEQAIETLERGRTLLWSEMRNLRASINQPLEAGPQLGHQLAAINRDLEELTMSVLPSHKLSTDNSRVDELGAMDPFGRLVLKQHRLLKERDNLISQAQRLPGPGFDKFLTFLSFDTLRSAASRGPVIIINHSIWRSDILILLHNTSPSLIPTPDDFYLRASALKDKLLDSRHRHGLGSEHYDETLVSVLKELYNIVGEPIIDRLRQLQVPEQSRIWWCPTSVFCFLPLHAMGPIPSDNGEVRYFLDLYICSYTPSLSALMQSRNRNFGSQSPDRPSLLLVAQPDSSLPSTGGEIQVVQSLDTEVTSLISGAATPAAVIEGFHHHQFVHLACGGTLKAGRPFDAGIELYGGERLTLLDIVRLNLPGAEFAFLSVGHSAEVTEESVVDEVLHLVAAVQFCGFRSVVGTMWAMGDGDGRDLAKPFYQALFSTQSGERGVPYHERSAKALQFAVKELRRKERITMERWVNFVHYGA